MKHRYCTTNYNICKKTKKEQGRTPSEPPRDIYHLENIISRYTDN